MFIAVRSSSFSAPAGRNVSNAVPKHGDPLELERRKAHSLLGLASHLRVAYRFPAMSVNTSIASRFRELRERAGLSLDEVAKQTGVSPWDIEVGDSEFTCCYSPSNVRRFCQAVCARPAELFRIDDSLSPVSAAELAQRIHNEYHSRGITLEQFEDIVGWRLSACMEPPELLLSEMSIDGMQWLCRELRIDWHRVILSL